MAASETVSAVPTVIVDDLHVDYRTFASGKAASERLSLFRRQRGVRIVHALKGVSFVAHEARRSGSSGTMARENRHSWARLPA